MGRWLIDWLWDLQGFTCREAIRLAARSMDAPLSVRERAALTLHHRLCDGCRTYRRQLRLLRRWIGRMDAPDSAPFLLPPQAARRFKARLAAESSNHSKP